MGTTQFLGSTQREDCVCDQGNYFDSGKCIPCTAGMMCDEYGQPGPKQETGFKVEVVDDTAVDGSRLAVNEPRMSPTAAWTCPCAVPRLDKLLMFFYAFLWMAPSVFQVRMISRVLLVLDRCVGWGLLVLW